ncbi:hypothetical protein U1T56_11185 [Geminicoccaceae bacterium SYSU G07066]|uniref:Uncharacterized protein n=1 Tax=Benzoatithermus flavus TaxID=3108223 RepID=A0ABU8XTL3_9PROT
MASWRPSASVAAESDNPVPPPGRDLRQRFEARTDLRRCPHPPRPPLGAPRWRAEPHHLLAAARDDDGLTAFHATHELDQTRTHLTNADGDLSTAVARHSRL